MHRDRTADSRARLLAMNEVCQMRLKIKPLFLDNDVLLAKREPLGSKCVYPLSIQNIESRERIYGMPTPHQRVLKGFRRSSFVFEF